ncbi:MAG: methylmalonyl-CoA epimerase, partial [Calditrichia bacterium]|nr:methylmalonyl-CoA epimerase [Calditrichia bacterium]
MLEKIDHIGVATRDLAKTIAMYKDVFELTPVFEEEVTEQKVKVAGFKVGESTIEFLEPTSGNSPIAKFLENKGEGLHHMAIKVNNVEEMLAKLKEKDVRLIDETPRIGAEGKLIAFVHPKSMNGILLEL